MLGDGSLSRALALDYTRADISQSDRSMLDYAVRLTRDPASVRQDDVHALRAAGFSDRGILDICQVTAYYAYVNRLADGLGVELEAWWADEELTLSREELDVARGRRQG